MAPAFRLSDSELAAYPENVFKLIAQIGEGSYGTVHKAVHIRTGTIVAIKIVPIDNDLQEIIREVNVMNSMSSDYIVNFYGSYLKHTDLWIVLEYCGAGSVSDIMRLCETTLSEDQIAVTCGFALKGLKYLHDSFKIHRDIKAGNILWTTKGEAKLERGRFEEGDDEE